MKKILLFFIFIYSFASINNDMLLIEAKLYPKILYLLNDFDKKNIIKIAIIVNNNTLSIGKKLKSFIKDSKLEIDLVDSIIDGYDVYILSFPVKKAKVLELVKKKRVIFAIFPKDINLAMFSVTISQKVYPLINPTLLKMSNMKFNPIILKVGIVYEK